LAIVSRDFLHSYSSYYIIGDFAASLKKQAGPRRQNRKKMLIESVFLVNWSKLEHPLSHFSLRYFLLATLLFCGAAGFCRAESAAGGVGGSQQPDLAPFEGIEIDSIVVDNRNIYDTDAEEYDQFLFKLANRFHIKTRRNVVRREILQKVGDRFSGELAEETARNLRGRLKIYDAWVEPELLPNGKLLLRVVTIDQWSLTGGISYSREGNETRYQLGLEEENFLGRNQFVSFYYWAQSDDDNFIQTRFIDKRFLGRRLNLALHYKNDPVDGVKSFLIARPFYDLGQRYYYALELRKSSGRRDVYHDTLKIAESTFEGDAAVAELAYRFGRHNRKLLLQLTHEYNFEHSRDRRVFYANPQDSALAISSFPADSLYHQVSLETNFSGFRFTKLTNIDGFAYTEDFTLGYFADIKFGRAFFADFKDHHFDRLDLSLSRYMAHGAALLFFDYGHIVWFKGDSMLRHYTTLGVRHYNRLSDHVTLAFRGLYVSDWTANGNNHLLLGGTSGIRGYDKFFRTGDRKVVFNAESRLFTDVNFLSALFGGVVFFDWGSIWKSDEVLALGTSYAGAGLGLRIAFEKSTRNVVRIDLAYSQAGGLEFSIGTDQYFLARL